MTPSRATAAAPRPGSGRRPSRAIWIWALLPLVLLAALIAAIVRLEPAERLRPEGMPPVERLKIERATLAADGIHLDGDERRTRRRHHRAGDRRRRVLVVHERARSQLEHLGRTTLHVPYPWVAGEAHLVKILTSTGTAFEHEIAVAVETPKATAAPSRRLRADRPVRRRAARSRSGCAGSRSWPASASRGLDVLLAVTIGLLAFLFVDAVQRRVRRRLGARRRVPGHGALRRRRRRRLPRPRGDRAVAPRASRARRKAGPEPGAVLALLIAIGIGLHNFGEGLAIGAAFALGEAALGTLLIVGFTLHNTTEGLAILAPIAKERPSIGLLDQARADRRRADDCRRVAGRLRLFARGRGPLPRPRRRRDRAGRHSIVQAGRGRFDGARRSAPRRRSASRPRR